MSIRKKPTSVDDWFTEELFFKIFPYANASIVFSHDSKPFWTYKSFMDSIKWLNTHPNPIFHNFCNDSSDSLINKIEMAAFLAGTHQETGDPSLKVPYPWLWPAPPERSGPEVGEAGGLLAIMEGCCSMVAPHPNNTPPPFKGQLNGNVELDENTRYIIGLNDNDVLSSCVMNLEPINQLHFGLGSGTGAGVVFQPGLVGVSDNGTLYGEGSRSSNTSDNVRPLNELEKSKTNPQFACLGPYCQYGGRGAIQLSYNFNYSDCSIDLFGDYRLPRYPNLIVTTDRIKFNGFSKYFGFPGINPDGNNQLPEEIARTTPPARIMAWLVCLWFWMIPRSGRSLSCHQAMLEPKKYGITTANIIVNNDGGCRKGSWAWNKNNYYRRICKIMDIPNYEETIVCPPAIM
jgi:hypothetical protein